MKPPEVAGLPRRLASLLYEALLLAAVLLIATLPLTLLLGDVSQSIFSRYVMLACLLLAAGAYFVWQWRRGGQTLPMKTWKMRVEMADGSPITLRAAALRYALAVTSLLCAGLGFLWALADRDRQFLHDRLAGTRIIRVVS